MRNQLYYALRNRLSLRLWFLGIVVLVNVVFGFCGSLNLLGLGGRITAVTLSSIAVAAMFVGCILCDYEQIRSLFAAPAAYSSFLTPVPAWQMVSSRILVITALDILSLAVGTAGVVWQSFFLAALPREIYFSHSQMVWGEVLHLAILALLGYLLLLVTIFFAATLCKSVFFKFRNSALLGILLTCGLLYLGSWMDLIVAPLTHTYYRNLLWSIQIPLGFTVAGTVYTLLILVKIGLLFCGTSYLMERKINL